MQTAVFRKCGMLTILLFGISCALSGTIIADDFYVITGTHKNQKEAQKIAATEGGWVLNTNFYNKLVPHWYAVVRGPFKTKDEADNRLSLLTKSGRYVGSYVKNAGIINVIIRIGNKVLSPQLLAALLGEIQIDVMENKGGLNPCEPQEPYKNLSLSYVSIAREYNEKKDQVLFKPQDVQLEIGVFQETKRTGEVEHMRICAE